MDDKIVYTIVIIMVIITSMIINLIIMWWWWPWTGNAISLNQRLVPYGHVHQMLPSDYRSNRAEGANPPGIDPES